MSALLLAAQLVMNLSFDPASPGLVKDLCHPADEPAVVRTTNAYGRLMGDALRQESRFSYPCYGMDRRGGDRALSFGTAPGEGLEGVVRDAPPDGPVSVFGWFRFGDANKANRQVMLFNIKGKDWRHGLRLSYARPWYAPKGSIMCWYADGARGTCLSSTDVHDFACAPGVWHLVGVTTDGKTRTRVWLDGRVAFAGDIPFALGPEAEKPLVMGEPATAISATTDMFRVWKGELTADEVAALYETGRPSADTASVPPARAAKPFPYRERRVTRRLGVVDLASLQPEARLLGYGVSLVSGEAADLGRGWLDFRFEKADRAIDRNRRLGVATVLCLTGRPGWLDEPRLRTFWQYLVARYPDATAAWIWNPAFPKADYAALAAAVKAAAPSVKVIAPESAAACPHVDAIGVSCMDAHVRAAGANAAVGVFKTLKEAKKPVWCWTDGTIAAWSAGEAALRTAGERSAEVLRRLHAAGAACVIQRNGPCRYSQDPKMAYLGLPSARTAALADYAAALIDEEANDRRK